MMILLVCMEVNKVINLDLRNENYYYDLKGDAFTNLSISYLQEMQMISA